MDLVDTAGLREDDATEGGVTGVERAGIARAAAACETADLVLRVIDGRQIDEGHLTRFANHDLLVFSKVDLTGDRGPTTRADAIWTSVITGEGIGELAGEIVRRLVPEERKEPGLLAGAVPFTDRQVALVEDLRRTVADVTGRGPRHA